MEDIVLLTKELNTIRVEAFESLNTMVSDGHGNYCIIELDEEILALIKIEHSSNNIWRMFFDGERSNARARASIIFISPLGQNLISPSY